MRTALTRRPMRKLARQMPERPGMGLFGLLLCGFAIWLGVKILPDARRYWRIKRM